MKRPILLFIATISIFCSCKNTSNNDSKTYSQKESIFKYAKNVYACPESDTVIVYFSWDNTRDSIIYRIPQNVNSIAAFSTTDIAMLSELGAVDKITGVCDYFRISNTEVQQRYKQGLIQNVGTCMEVNIESLIALNPDIVISSAYSRADFERYKQIKKPVIFTMSWQENSPLARLEWIKFIGILIGEYNKADSIFTSIEQKYIALTNKTKSVNKPLVLAGAASGDIWYLPGGESYVARFIADAGGEFIGENDNHTGSIVVNFENILQQSQNADFWIGCDERTYQELDANNKNYKLLPVYQKQTIYNRSKRTNAQGGNDYWEYGYVRPDLVLADYIRIIHPNLLPNYETTFFDKVR